jgi:hypothetical protein
MESMRFALDGWVRVTMVTQYEVYVHPGIEGCIIIDPRSKTATYSKVAVRNSEDAKTEIEIAVLENHYGNLSHERMLSLEHLAIGSMKDRDLVFDTPFPVFSIPERALAVYMGSYLDMDEGNRKSFWFVVENSRVRNVIDEAILTINTTEKGSVEYMKASNLLYFYTGKLSAKLINVGVSRKRQYFHWESLKIAGIDDETHAMIDVRCKMCRDDIQFLFEPGNFGDYMRQAEKAWMRHLSHGCTGELQIV